MFQIIFKTHYSEYLNINTNFKILNEKNVLEVDKFHSLLKKYSHFINYLFALNSFYNANQF